MPPAYVRPDITGRLQLCQYSGDLGTASGTGALSKGSELAKHNEWGGQGIRHFDVYFDASGSNAIYGGASTVQVPSIYVLIIVKT